MWVKALVSFLFHLLICSTRLAAAQKCYDTDNFTTTSTYGRNRDLILTSLPPNVSANGGFFNSTLGQGSDKVYALALCRGDSSSDACYSCINSTVHDLVAKCPNQKEALSWSGDQPCLVRYTDRQIFGIRELEPADALYNTGDLRLNLTQFDEVWESLMDRVVTKASMGSSRLKYATGEAEFMTFQKIYALMQCTPDLSHDDCDSCLRESVGRYQSCCHGKQGGVVQRPSCYFRWDMYSFYTPSSSTSATTPFSPPPPPHGTPPSPPPVDSTTTKGGGGSSSQTPIIIAVPAVISVAAAVLAVVLLMRRKKTEHDKNKKKENSQEVQLLDLLGGRIHSDPSSSKSFNGENMDTSKELPSIQLDILHAATHHFSDENKLGEGGFGPVYKGTLADGKEIAVKRLSRTSGQGLLEFKNEIMLIARLQHRNLVRLLGCCLEKNEKLLVYEFMPNRSLDIFLFDSNLATQLDWLKRFSIIKGVARGMMYLHEDSRLRIIHRDLKASNVLLDHEMNPKISDFGMARIFGGDQNEANTNRVVGTYGYMAPEYAMEGLFSTKSDVFSFGVLLLEIISGKKNNGFHLSERGESLLTFAWKLWSKGQAMELIDQLLVQSCVAAEVLKCIHIGLLCVQGDPADRPSMSSVIVMLGSDTITLPRPAEPAFFVGRIVPDQPTQPSTSNDRIYSVNEVTISNMSPR